MAERIREVTGETARLVPSDYPVEMRTYPIGSMMVPTRLPPPSITSRPAHILSIHSVIFCPWGSVPNASDGARAVTLFVSKQGIILLSIQPLSFPSCLDLVVLTFFLLALTWSS